MTDDMKDEYDFSKAERGRFYHRDATLAPPVHLDPEVLAFPPPRPAPPARKPPSPGSTPSRPRKRHSSGRSLD
jgi:hypothetical protein